MRLFTIFAALACLLVTADPGSAQEQINRADRKAMRETRDTMRSLAQDLRTLYNINDEYPEELKAVVDSKLRESVPQDAWGREFAYQLSDEHGYELTSWGADGARRRRRRRHRLDTGGRAARTYRRGKGRA